jgi:phosphatidate cytidylyltransferase
MSEPRAWDDLAPRILSALVMAALGLGLIWLGGWPFLVFVSVIAGLMVWEAARMFGSPRPLLDGGFAGLVLFLSVALPGGFSIVLLLVSALVSAGMVTRDRAIYGVFHAAILLAAFALTGWRDEAGLAATLWLIAVVIASDVLGYFAGKMIGGPKFWPRVSPKKTWSGTIAGWLGGGLVGLCFVATTPLGWALAPLSMLVAFAGQMGDIAESAVKRRMGVKDSSNLIPGHGGVLDRLRRADGGVALHAILLALMLGFGG